jgi:hypothetical protein
LELGGGRRRVDPVFAVASVAEITAETVVRFLTKYLPFFGATTRRFVSA